MILTLKEFEKRCQPSADALEDSLLRYNSSWRDWNIMYPTLWPFFFRVIAGRFPWELQ